MDRHSLSVIVLCLAACSGMDESNFRADDCGEDNFITAPQMSNAALHRPQALLFVGEFLVVTNTAYDGGTWDDGFVVIIDTNTRAVVNLWKTSAKNPQALAIHGGYLYVVNTGTFDLSDFERPKVLEPGTVERVPVEDLDKDGIRPEVFSLSGSTANADFRAPTDLAFIGANAVITSALDPAVLLTSFEEGGGSLMGPVIRYESDAQLGLGGVATWQNQFVIVDFNADRLYLLDPSDPEIRCPTDIGLFDGELEGALAPLVVDDRVYVIMALSGIIRAVELGPLAADCPTQISTPVSPLGQIPNDMLRLDQQMAVVESGDNRIRLYSLDGGENACQWTLPVGSNPWSLTRHAQTQTLAVSEWGTNSVLLIDRRGGASIRFGSKQP
ncbi:MAG: hypothetical protein VX589_07220 [Myxococcota bacterium]|nr:hypothetical protein [Myxococcota bacterium]